MKEILTSGMLVPLKVWNGDGSVPMEPQVIEQMSKICMLPFVARYAALMPDGHYCNGGASVGSVIPTRKAIIPASVGCDAGCGIKAIRLDLTSKDISDNGQELFEALTKAIPCNEWSNIPNEVHKEYSFMDDKLKNIASKVRGFNTKNVISQLGTIGKGNHFNSLAVDEEDKIWLMVHSGSRGIGNKIGTYFINLAKKDMEHHGVRLPDKDLAYLEEGSPNFLNYMEAIGWAQNYAAVSRNIMIKIGLDVIRKTIPKQINVIGDAINIHHNYVEKENHYGEDLYITRKGAVSSRLGQLSVIPGSMGGKSYITRGKGNTDSFCSSSHGAGRVMSRGVAKRTITLDEHEKAMQGVFCRKDIGVLDESKAAYKDIDAVMAAQSDLVDVVHVLQEIVNIKG